MLKAVRFDENKHKDLLDFITNFKDRKGKINESEGIRYLMELGYAQATSEPPPNDDTPSQWTIFDVAEIKEELRKEILEELAESNKHTEKHQPLDVDDMKKQITNDIMRSVSDQAFETMNQLIDKLGSLQQQVVYASPIQENVEPVQQFTKVNTPKDKKPIEIPTDTNPLLANMLANANR